MRKKYKFISTITIIILWLSLSVFAWVKPSNERSVSERRKLKQFPEVSMETITNGNFTEDFESYTLDQFPFRDTFRTLKAGFNTYGLMQKDNNDIYISKGHAAKQEYPLNEKWVNNSIEKITHLYEKYMKDTDCNVYLSVIPDKNYYLAEESGHLSMDYQKLFDMMKTIDFAKYIDITDRLSYNSYYRTDTHWKQDWITTVAERICSTMGTSTEDIGAMKPWIVSNNFYGVYYGQAALPIEPDEMMVIFSDITEGATVIDHETGERISVYNTEAVNNSDQYDYFLHGSKALLEIQNPNATTDKELVIFRDSFGSTIAPLMLKDYKTVWLVDIRYIASDLVGNFIKFDNQDVLFLYSTLVLNNSSTFK